MQLRVTRSCVIGQTDVARRVIAVALLAAVVAVDAAADSGTVVVIVVAACRRSFASHDDADDDQAQQQSAHPNRNYDVLEWRQSRRHLGRHSFLVRRFDVSRRR